MSPLVKKEFEQLTNLDTQVKNTIYIFRLKYKTILNILASGDNLFHQSLIESGPKWWTNEPKRPENAWHSSIEFSTNTCN